MEGFVDCFEPDGRWTIAGLELCGHAEIGRQLEAFLAPSVSVMMFAGRPHLLGDTARVEITEIIRRRDGSLLRTLGTYHDRLAADGGRFRHRRLELHYRGPADLSGEWTRSILSHAGHGPATPAP